MDPRSFRFVNGAAKSCNQPLLEGNITPDVTGLAKYIKLDLHKNKYLIIRRKSV